MRNEKIQIDRLNNAKAAIAEAITEKGVEVPESTKLDGYPALIGQISGGGGSGEPWPPFEPPDEENVYIYIAIPAIPDKNNPYIRDIKLVYYQSVGDDSLIDWGDGTQEAIQNNGVSPLGGYGFEGAHTYQKAGNYVIKITAPISGELYFWDSFVFLGNGYKDDGPSEPISNHVVAMYTGKAACIISLEVSYLSNLKYFACHKIGELPSAPLEFEGIQLGSLLTAVLPEGYEELSQKLGGALIRIEFPKSLKTITYATGGPFYHSYSIREIHFRSTSPPALESNLGIGLPNECVIYVPKGCSEAYKTATNWTIYASQIQEEPG